MSQKVRIKSVHASTPILINIDANQQPVMSANSDVIMIYQRLVLTNISASAHYA